MSGPRVSDHALLRFLERAGGMDVEGGRTSLSASLERAADGAKQLGLGRYIIVADDLLYIVEGRDLVTVLPDTGRAAHLRATRRRRG